MNYVLTLVCAVLFVSMFGSGTRIIVTSGMFETRKQILNKNGYVLGCSSSDPLGVYVLAPDPLGV